MNNPYEMLSNVSLLSVYQGMILKTEKLWYRPDEQRQIDEEMQKIKQEILERMGEQHEDR